VNILLFLPATVVVRAFTLMIGHVPISVECVFSMTLLPGGGAAGDTGDGVGLGV
jgi:hypothetical protein